MTMDAFSDMPATLSAPARDGAAVTPNDGADLSINSRAIYVGQAGNLAVVMVGGQAVNFTGIAAGTLLPVRVSRVRATGTTAGSIVALW